VRPRADIFGNGGASGWRRISACRSSGDPDLSADREGSDTGVPLMISEPDSPAGPRPRAARGADRRAGVDCQLQPANIQLTVVK